jgi:plastocyanin
MAGLLLLASCGSVGATAQVAANPPTGTNLPGFVPGGPTTTVAGGASMPGMTGMTGTTGTTNSGHIGTATASAAPANAAAAPATANTVSIQNFAFSPAAVTVRVGTTVTWTNKDADAHTVTSSDGQLHSPVLQTGATFSHTFAQAGSYHYLCTIHPFMTAVVTVTR